MTDRQVEAIARMLVTLAAMPPDEQLDVVVQVVKTWLERDSPYCHPFRRRLWLAATRAGER